MRLLQNHYFRNIILTAACVMIIMLAYASVTPGQFKKNSQVVISKNSGLTAIASILEANHIIKSPLLFKAAVVLFGGEKSIPAGDYLFSKPQSVWQVAYNLSHGNQGFAQIKVTIPEGSSVDDIAFILLKDLPDFNAPYFVKIAKGSEGYLFPDTYYFMPNVTSEDVVAAMKANYNSKIADIRALIKVYGRSETDIIKMASILEKEANTTESRKIIAGILWKRLDNQMALQVDSDPDTYKRRGLPDVPISDPGLDAIKDALTPTSTKYWYYLSDSKGMFHYAVNYEDHLINKAKYIQ